jgi:hypothetical protein
LGRKHSPLIIVCILALSVIAVAAACGTAEPSPSSPPSPQDTTVEEAAFRLTLPGTWTSVATSDPDRWAYRSDGAEQVTVSVWGLDEGLSRDQRMQAMRRLVTLRRGAETEASGAASLELTSTRYGEADGILAARYGGSDPATGRRFNCLVLGGESAVTFVYYESLELAPQQSDARARTIFNSVSVPQ